MVQVATWWLEDGKAVEPEFAQVHPVPLAESVELAGGHGAPVPPPKHELPLVKGPERVHADAFVARLADFDIPDHILTVELTQAFCVRRSRGGTSGIRIQFVVTLNGT